MPRTPTCQCGACPLCTGRGKSYREKSIAERRAWVARRDPEKVRANDRARYARDKPKRRAAMDDYARTPRGRAAGNRAKAKWIASNPEKRRAQNAVAAALRSGVLVRGPCERQGPDCSSRIHAHHDDYTKPLEVRWLCAAHHRAEHNTQRF